MKNEFQMKVSFTNENVKSVTNSTFSRTKIEKKEFSFVPRPQGQVTPSGKLISITNRRKYRFI